MKPTVIASKASDNHPHPAANLQNLNQSDANNNFNSAGGGSVGGGGGSGGGIRNNTDFRGFPQTPASHGFPYDDSDDDIFSDMDLRSRLNRMGHNIPFDWGVRKRRGSGGGAPTGVSGGGVSTASGASGVHIEIPTSQYDQYFHGDEDFPGFPSHHWGDTFGRMSGRKRNPQTHPFEMPGRDRSGFFDYLPPEFRQYIPDSFVFPNRHPQSPSMTRSPPVQRHNPVYAQTQPPPPPPPPPTAQQQQQQQLTSPTRCDAAIQTEDSPFHEGNSLNQHGLRNTVDLGQRSPPEGINVDRSHSAPPPECGGANLKKPSDFFHTQYKRIPAERYEDMGTSMTPQIDAYYQPPQFSNQPEQMCPTSPTLIPQQQQQQQSQNNNFQRSNGQEYVRTIPIFIEGHDKPITPKNIHQTHQQQSQPPSQATPPSSSKVPSKQQHRPEPFVGLGQQSPDIQQQQQQQQQQPHTNALPTPQTPHTTDCIFKIQAIQRDVLSLMEQVEKFSGTRADKDYVHLDEMLTRNLLKLDNIDTNGRERIRLARKEAIKCIQASIAVLEAKADQKTKQQEAGGDDQEQQSCDEAKSEMDVECSDDQSADKQREPSDEFTGETNKSDMSGAESIESKQASSETGAAAVKTASEGTTEQSTVATIDKTVGPTSPAASSTVKHRSEVNININCDGDVGDKKENGCACNDNVVKE